MALLHLCSAQTPRGDAPIHKFLSKLSLGGNLKVARPSIVTAADHPATMSAWFRRELQNILANEDSQEVISWLPEGNIWRIHNLDAFRIQVIPQVPFICDFAHPLELFLAYVKVNGFRGISRGLNSVAFYNEVSSLDGESPYSLDRCCLTRDILPNLQTFVRDGPWCHRHSAAPNRRTILISSSHRVAVSSEAYQGRLSRASYNPLPPPPFTLKGDERSPRFAGASQNKNNAYYVDSTGGMRQVRVSRAKDVANEQLARYPKKANKAVKGKAVVKAPRRRAWLPTLSPLHETDRMRLLMRAASSAASAEGYSSYCGDAEGFSPLSSLKLQASSS
jgi:hypothetical protein